MKKIFFTLSVILLLAAACKSSKPTLKETPPAPQNDQSVAANVQGIATTAPWSIQNTTEWKTYENKEYGFSFQYPAEWGEVVFETDNTDPSVDREGDCEASGYAVFGHFSNSQIPNLQFGAVSKDYKICLGRGGGLADYVKFEILGDKIRMRTWGSSDTLYADYKLEKEISTATTGKKAYIFKNTTWTDEQNALPAAIAESPSSKIQAMSFEPINGGDYTGTLETLEKILSTFKYSLK